MIDKLNTHYSMTNPASVYDEEALTALELAGRTTAKVNEVVDAQNKLQSDTTEHLNTQDENIEQIRTVTVPADVSKEVQKQINNGTFDDQIDKSLNHLNDRVDNLLGKVTEGSTTMDAEIIDGRVDDAGSVHENLGDAIRYASDTGIVKPLKPTGFLGIFGSTEIIKNGKTNVVKLTPNSDYPVGVGVWVKGQANKFYKVVTNISNFDFYVRNDAMGTYQNNVNVTVVKNDNVVYFNSESDFNVFTFKMPENVETEFTFSVFENSESPLIYPSNLSENVTPFNRNINVKLVHGILSTITRKSSEDCFVQEYTYTPSQANSMSAFAIDAGTTSKNTTPIKTKTHYRITLQGIPANAVQNILYGTEMSWGMGSYATLIQNVKFNQQTETTVIDFVVRENNVNAAYLMVRLRVNDTVTFKMSLEEIVDEREVGAVTDTHYIAFCGDSLTAQQYYNYISTGVKSKVAFAIGGEGVKHIFARTGVTPLFYTSPTIENGKNKVTLSETGLFGQGMGNINPVTIAGIQGNLSLENGNYYFTPLNEIESTPVFRPLVVPHQATLNIDAYVFWVGTNGLEQTPSNTIFERWKEVLNVYPNTIIIGMTKDFNDTLKEQIATLDELGATLGSRYIAVHDWVVTYGLNYCGLTATDDDNAAIANNQIPPSLLNDSTHFNEYGKRCVAHLVEERLKLLNII